MPQFGYCPYCLRPVFSGALCQCGENPSAYRPEPYHFPAGQILYGRYYIGRVLGEGGFGITYLGLDTKLGDPVAIKEFFPRTLVHRDSLKTMQVTCYPGSEDTYQEERELFLKEAKTLAQIEDIPQVVSVRDHFSANNSAYIVMEYLRGWTLKQMVAKQGVMPIHYVLRIMEPVLKALDTVHKRGHLHRDISPDNLMTLSEDGRVMLMDFGCSRRTGRHTMTAVEKPGYAPLENTTGYGQGPWSDVYGVCATMYFCLTGVTPPGSVQRMEEDTLVPPSKLGCKITLKQEKALLKGMAVSAKERWQSVGEMYEALYGKTLAGIVLVADNVKDTGDMGDVTRYVHKAKKDKDENKPLPSRKQKKVLLPALIALVLLCGVLFWFFHPHLYGQWETTLAASCEKAGREERRCFCGETESRILPAAGHRWEKDAAVDASCVQPGLTEGSHCGECGAVQQEQQLIPVAEHTLVTLAAVEPSCTEPGLTEGVGCAVCGYTVTAQQSVAAEGHTFVTDAAQPASCSAEGKTEGEHCERCGYVSKAPENLPKTSHTPVADPAQESSCTSEGKTEGSHCSQCGLILTAQKTVEKKPHTVVTQQAVEPTCTKDGLTEGSCCSVCDAVLVPQETVEAVGHTYSERKCTQCGAYAPSEGLEYTLSGDHYIVSIGQCTDSHVVIPSTYNGKPVTEIARDGFSGSSVTRVTIPSSVKTIGDCAFLLCNNLTTVTISSGVNTIGVGAFSASGLTSVTIPSTVTTIGECAFEMCTSLKTVTIQNGVKTIGYAAFQYCSRLASVSIPSSVTKIEDRAFERCYALRNVVIPSSVSTMGERVFVQCHMDTIYCRASSQPSGWNANWNVIEDESNDSRFSTVWGYSG